ncbi:Fe-S protein assembly co-chaperone HscB [Nitrospirales bacterium NOB]|nr:MAG: co-chaperone protein HscB [Nitrospira sp. OLB3]MBV6468588.1 Co-chaperone protein HscB [Nitrospirota bacterium]MCE7965185.1 Fe-S protein assembly co-chaperone HscB [Nitrospira sp. NTP2]MCK6491887.1 Fe-S protein assembly co-chaperone HscB [Nitrospira sp.]MDL1888489.1 Fe-S protein assembly co-chaperone HscB [Nitrospirales bacterium NOB]MEB2340033.1 Fe-S protein assembly co-chaperone HscB [Nitrospirales bacterium]
MEQTSKVGSSRTELQMARSMCWHCQSEVTGEYFCDRCVKVQPLSKELDYFTCLGLPRFLTIDASSLENKFYEMSRSFHPDFYQTKTDTERTISLGNSALLNTAYRTLKDPIQRAEYLVRLEAGAAKEIRNSPPADLFEEILSLQDDLEEFRAAATQPSTDLTELKAKLQSDRETLEGRQQDMESKLFDLFETWDRLQRQGEPTEAVRAKKEAVLKEMRELLSNRTYVRNIVNDLIATVG